MKKKIIIILLLIAAIVSAAWFLWLKPARNGGGGALVLYGNVDIRELNMAFRVPGRIVELLFDEGDFIEKDALVARLDDATYRHEWQQTKAALGAAEAEARRLESGYRPEEIAQARAAVAEAQANYDNAVLSAGRAEKLTPSGALTQEEYDNRVALRSESQQRLNSAKANLALLEAGYRAEEIERAKAQVEEARAAVEAAKTRLDDTRLLSPSSGTLYTRALEPGSMVQAGTTVITLSLDDPVWVRAYVNEPNLGRVSPGTRVEIITDSRPDKPYVGNVGFVSPRSEFTPKTVQTEELRTSLVYRLRIVVENPDSLLRQGMPVTIRIKSDGAGKSAAEN